MATPRPFNWRSESGMQVLYLGEVPIGRVDETPPGPLGCGPGRWQFYLTGSAHWRAASTKPKAKAALLEAANAWLNRAGWV